MTSPTWDANGITARYAIVYDACPTVGEETTVTLVDMVDGNVESHVFIAREIDDDQS